MSNNSTSNSVTTLSPFDISEFGMGFGLYRPRRPSYTFATQYNRTRSESYRYAIRRENADSTSEVSNGEDFIEGVLRNKARKVSYLKATRQSGGEDTSPKVGMVVSDEDVRPAMIDPDSDASTQKDSPLHVEGGESVTVTIATNNHTPGPMHTPQFSGDHNAMCESQNYINHKCATHRKFAGNSTVTRNQRPAGRETRERTLTRGTPNHRTDTGRSLQNVMSNFSFNKNIIILCLAFILVFSSFRAIQNLQSSMHTHDNLGILTMMTVHISMIFACLLSPIVINIFTAKWALCMGVLCFLLWFGAHFYPTFYTLIPTSLFVGFGQGILWNAESSYILKLAFDSARVTQGYLDREMFRFHGIFLACFQTTHIWGNLISSLLLSQRANEISNAYQTQHAPDHSAFVENGNVSDGNYPDQPIDDGTGLSSISQCGALHRCIHGSVVPMFPNEFDDNKILAPVLWKLMTCYIVLGVLSFGLIFLFLDRIGARADPEKNPRQYFVTCRLGINLIGYCMITLGVANVLGAIFMAVFSHKIPREVVLGFGGIVHIALMIGYLIWIPEPRLILFLVLAAAWGVCDAVWQTQCNTLICLTCTEEPEVAFTNYRLVQSIGLAIMFGCGTWMCVSAKLYMLMTLLVVAIMFYVLAEYRLRHDDDDVFEDP